MLNLLHTRRLEILTAALNALYLTTGVKAWIAPLLPFAERESDSDAVIQVVAGDYTWDFSVKIKANITNNALAPIISELQASRPQGLLVTTIISSDQADKLRKAGVPFIDMAGNAFIEKPAMYIYVTGRRVANDLRTERVPRLFTASGLKVLFSFLTQPGMENHTYRQIADASGTSLGSVSQIMEELAKKQYLFEGPTGRRLFKKEELVRQWVNYYPARLRPKLLVSRFSSKDKDWWKKVNLQEMDACWGGEVAAALVTAYLKPETQTIYTNMNPAQLQMRFGWKRDPNGEIEVLKKFWVSDQDSSDQKLAPMLLIYADLAVSSDERNMETAKMIYDDYIARSFR